MGSIGGQILGSFWSKMGEIIADYAHNKMESNFKLITLQDLQKSLKSLSVKACDVEEQIKHAERSGQKKRKREVEEWLVEVKSIETQVVELGTRVESQGFIKWLMDGRVATQLNEKVCKLLGQTSHFGELVVDICGIRGVKMLTTRMVGEAFDRNSEEIWSFLQSNSILSIGVHGMGGVGKTTLAKRIYNKLQETYGECSVFWVTVSQEFTIKSLQERIAHVLGVNLSGEDDETIRAQRVSRVLSEMKNAILILDDVWKYIDLLKVGVPLYVDCCRLILTTRSKQVCEQMLCQKLIKVDILRKDEAWKLFRETFTGGKEIKLDPEVEAIVKSVAEFCGGLPLGIVTMAATMRGEKTIHAWRNALVELREHFSHQDDRWKCEVFTVLKYSFDRLHESESKYFNSCQLCFLHLSLYPEDCAVEKKDLIKDFISDGLLDIRKSRTEQIDLGNVILDKLVSVCLFELDEFERVKMHDLVRGMALKVCEGKYMVRARDLSLEEIPKEKEWREDVEKVSLMRNGIRRIEYGISPNCPNLSTLLLQNNRNLEFIPNSFFRKMQGLCTLNLSYTDISMLPNSLSDLNSLKVMILRRCGSLEKVPYLGNLKALRELNLSETAIREVPQGVEELLNLRLLSMDGASKLEVLRPRLLRKLESLQCVSFPYHLKAPIEGTENMKELVEFRGSLESVRDLNHIIESHRMHYYVFYVGPGYDPFFEIYSYNFKELFVSVPSPEDDVKFLQMQGCEGLSKCLLDNIKNLTSLRELKLSNCGGIEFILSAQESLFDPLPSLEQIQLCWCEDFKGVIDTPAPTQCVFLSLKLLNIEHCPKIRKLRLPVSGFPNLEDIRIEGCSEIEEIFEDDERVESVTLPNLKCLGLQGLPRLECICRKAIICNSIQQIKMIKCPRYEKKLPVHLDVPPPPTLRWIEADREWWESLEWYNPHLPPLLQPFVDYF